jgi:GNAT superfamily N-acetyltransferase
MKDAFGVEISKMRVPGKGIVRMRTRVTPKTSSVLGLGVVQAKNKGKEVGNLATHQKLFPEHRGHIVGVEVDREFRRKGIATEMLRTAKRVGHNPTHSNALTLDGGAWAKAVGGPAFGKPNAPHTEKFKKTKGLVIQPKEGQYNRETGQGYLFPMKRQTKPRSK